MPAFTKIFPPVAGSALIASCNVVKSPFDGSGLTTNVDSYRSIGLWVVCSVAVEPALLAISLTFSLRCGCKNSAQYPRDLHFGHSAAKRSTGLFLKTDKSRTVATEVTVDGSIR